LLSDLYTSITITGSAEKKKKTETYLSCLLLLTSPLSSPILSNALPDTCNIVTYASYYYFISKERDSDTHWIQHVWVPEIFKVWKYHASMHLIHNPTLGYHHCVCIYNLLLKHSKDNRSWK